jgi:hypothetical protein
MSEPNAQRLEICKRAWQLKTKFNLSFADIAREMGLMKGDKPRRGLVEKMIATYTRWRVVDELRQQLQVVEARVLELEAATEDELFGHDLGAPWELDGDVIIAGDVHANTINREFMHRPLQVAELYLEKPRRFILAGDFLNANAFGGYEATYPEPSFGKELRAAREFINMYLEVFDEIWVLVGNHDLRVTRKTNTAIMPEDLLRMISHDERVKVSHWGYALLNTERGVYRITHGSEYSVNQLVVAEQLALKNGQNVVSWHEHHTAIGLDRFKKHILVNGGGLFDQGSMAYTQIEDNKKPRMANGFVMIRRGYPYLFSDRFTDWQFWLKGVEMVALDEQIFAERKAG